MNSELSSHVGNLFVDQPLEVVNKIMIGMDYADIVTLFYLREPFLSIIESDFFWISKIQHEFGITRDELMEGKRQRLRRFKSFRLIYLYIATFRGRVFKESVRWIRFDNEELIRRAAYNGDMCLIDYLLKFNTETEGGDPVPGWQSPDIEPYSNTQIMDEKCPNSNGWLTSYLGLNLDPLTAIGEGLGEAMVRDHKHKTERMTTFNLILTIFYDNIDVILSSELSPRDALLEGCILGAAIGGDTKMALDCYKQQLAKDKQGYKDRVFRGLCIGGHLKKVRKYDPPPIWRLSRSDWSRIIENDHLPILKFLFGEEDILDWDRLRVIMLTSVLHNKPDILNWAFSSLYDPMDKPPPLVIIQRRIQELFNEFGTSGNTTLFLEYYKKIVTDNYFKFALNSKEIENLLRYSSAMFYNACSGQQSDGIHSCLDLIRLMVDMDLISPLNDTTLINAGLKMALDEGNIDVVDYLRSLGGSYPWYVKNKMYIMKYPEFNN